MDSTMKSMGGFKVGERVRVKKAQDPKRWWEDSRAAKPAIWRIKSFQCGMLDEMVELEREGVSSRVTFIEDLVHLDVIERLGEVSDG